MLYSSARRRLQLGDTAPALSLALLCSCLGLSSNATNDDPRDGAVVVVDAETTVVDASVDASESTGDGGDAFDYSDLSEINMDLFPSADDVWQSVEAMVSLGPRHTGSEAHQRFVGQIEQWMLRIGCSDITRETVTIEGAGIFTSPGAPTSGETDHIYCVLEGATDETIIMGVHSDGQNAVEENGVPVILSIAEYLSRVPAQYRRRSYMLVFPTGHMADVEYGESWGWLERHPDLVSEHNVVAAVAPEHMAAVKLVGGLYEFRVAATTTALENEANARVAELDIEAMSVGSTGIGTSLGWQDVGLPTLAGMCTPIYLFDLDAGMDRLDRDQLWLTTFFFTQMVGFMDGSTADELAE